jgi:hypothetical protein
VVVAGDVVDEAGQPPESIQFDDGTRGGP